MSKSIVDKYKDLDLLLIITGIPQLEQESLIKDILI